MLRGLGRGGGGGLFGGGGAYGREGVAEGVLSCHFQQWL